MSFYYNKKKNYNSNELKKSVRVIDLEKKEKVLVKEEESVKEEEVVKEEESVKDEESVKEKELIKEEEIEELDSQKLCRICYDSLEDNENLLLRPCNCAGSMKWVHKKCLLTWINMNENNKKCNVCNFKYKIDYKCITPFLEKCNNKYVFISLTIISYLIIIIFSVILNNLINKRPLLEYNIVHIINSNKIFLFINVLFVVIYCFYYNNSEYDYQLYCVNSIISICVISIQIIYSEIKKNIKNRIKYDYFIYNVDE